MDGKTLNQMIRRRKSRSKKYNECDSAAAIRAMTQNNDWFCPEVEPTRHHFEPIDWDKIFAAIARAYNLTPDKLRELLQALTDSRILLGYKHPVARFRGYPLPPDAA